MPQETIWQHMQKQGVTRREFMKMCGVMVGAMGLHVEPPVRESGLPAHMVRGFNPITTVAHALQTKPRVPVIWLEFQDCAGCSEALTRSHDPTLVDLVLKYITIEYHETLMAANGFQAEQAKADAMKAYASKYVLVVEGSIPEANDGVYCTIGGRTALDILKETAAGAAAIISTGNCAAFGGIPKAKPNPTGAKGVWELVTDKPVVNISGCPAIPEATTGTLFNFIVFGALPELDHLNRPKTFYGQTVHDRCLRRPFYEAGKFVETFDDEGARRGYCLYKLGCKGPTTYNACATLKWGSGLSFPIQAGHPCLGCSEPNFWDGGGFYQGQSAPLDRPTILTAAGAAAVGVAAGAGIAMANRRQKAAKEPETPRTPEQEK